MIINLHVKNLALIDEIEVEFGPGLNILTGETGAGKSIVIGSINLALGGKMSRDMIRAGADSALVELVFHTENPKALAALREMELDGGDGQVIISRKISGSRSICKINGETCTVAQIKRLAAELLDIHGQHEHQSLLYQERQQEILDEYGKERLREPLRRTEEAYLSYRELQGRLKEYQIDEESRLREIDFLEFELQEIEEAALTEGEDEELEAQYRRMVNARKIAEQAALAHRLSGYEEDSGAGEQIGRALKELLAVAECDAALDGLCSMLSDIDGLLNDFNRELSEYMSGLSFSEEAFFEVEKRLDQINRLKAKYGSSLSEIRRYAQEKYERLQKLQNFEEQKRKLTEELQGAEEKLEELSHTLSEERKSCSERLTREIERELRELNFADVRFEIRFERAKSYSAKGYDRITFLIATNPGEPIKELARVVSGGELSRIMLALKTLLADRDDTETLIFDEIDTGISGRTAQKVSEKMARIGRGHQILCITHLPQIAAMADLHFQILKSVENGETKTMIRRLSEAASVEELARILGGARITEAVEENAKEMKELARVHKSSRL